MYMETAPITIDINEPKPTKIKVLNVETNNVNATKKANKQLNSF